MGRYERSYFRLALLLILLLTVSLAWGQGTPGTVPAKAGAPISNSFSLVLDNLDFVFYTIGILSVAGLALIIHGFWNNRQGVFLPADVTNRIRGFIQVRDWTQLTEFVRDDDSFVSRSLYPAMRRFPDFGEMRESLETAVSEQTAEQFRKIEYLNIIGNLGPLLGLLGTVLGMIEAFTAMNAAGGQASPADLAGGISKALAHTMLGLLLAVPCLAAFGVLRTMVDRLTVKGALLAEDLFLAIRQRYSEVGEPAVSNQPLETGAVR
ncbi:MAG TPA: MotA/TolQ/ExbB proton channel family protein [Tepidisphaeraceae bacterium]